MNLVVPQGTGPEFEALHRLPPEEQRRVWRRAYKRMLRTPTAWAGAWGLGCCCGMGVMLAMASAKVLGFDQVGTLLFGIIMGSGAGASVGAYTWSQLIMEHTRPFLREELAHPVPGINSNG